MERPPNKRLKLSESAISDNAANETAKKLSRKEMLQKWKKEKLMKKQLEMKMKKKPFYVGGNVGSQLPSLQKLPCPPKSTSTKPLNKPAQKVDSTNCKNIPKMPFKSSEAVPLPTTQVGSASCKNMPKMRAKSSQAVTLPTTQINAACRSQKSSTSKAPNKSVPKVNTACRSQKCSTLKAPNKSVPKVVERTSCKNVPKMPSKSSEAVKLPRTQINAACRSQKSSTLEAPNKSVPKGPRTSENKIKKRFPDKMKVVKVKEKQPDVADFRQIKQVIETKLQLMNLEDEIQDGADMKNISKQNLTTEEETIKCRKEIKSSEEELLETNPENISDLTLNCDLSVIKTESSFAPLGFKFQPPPGLSAFLFEDDNHEAVENRSLKCMLRTSTPTKEVQERAYDCFSKIHKSSTESISKNDYPCKVVLHEEVLLRHESPDKQTLEEKDETVIKRSLCENSLEKLLEKDVEEQIETNSSNKRDVDEKIYFKPETGEMSDGKVSSEGSIKEKSTSNQDKEFIISTPKSLSNERIIDSYTPSNMGLGNEEVLTFEIPDILIHDEKLKEEGKLIIKDEPDKKSPRKSSEKEDVDEQIENCSLKKLEEENLLFEPVICHKNNKRLTSENSFKMSSSNLGKGSNLSLQKSLYNETVTNTEAPCISLHAEKLVTSEILDVLVSNRTCEVEEKLIMEKAVCAKLPRRSLDRCVHEQVVNYSLQKMDVEEELHLRPNLNETNDGKLCSQYLNKEMPASSQDVQLNISLTKSLSNEIMSDPDNQSKVDLYNEELLTSDTPDILASNEVFEEENLITEENICSKSLRTSFEKKDIDDQIENDSMKKMDVTEKLAADPEVSETNDKVSSEYLLNEMNTSNQTEESLIPLQEVPEIKEVKQAIKTEIQSVNLEQEKQDGGNAFTHSEVTEYKEKKSADAVFKRYSVCKKSIAGTTEELIAKSPVKPLKSQNTLSSPRRSLRLSQHSEVPDSHAKSSVKTPKSQNSLLTPRRSVRLIQKSKMYDDLADSATKISYQSSPAPTHHTRLLNSLSKKCQFDYDILSPFKAKKQAYINFTPSHYSTRLTEFFTDSDENEPVDTPGKSECKKTNITADFSRLALHSDENMDPNVHVHESRISPETVFKLKSRKNSLFSSEKRKSMTGNIFFSPKSN